MCLCQLQTNRFTELLCTKTTQSVVRDAPYRYYSRHSSIWPVQPVQLYQRRAW